MKYFFALAFVVMGTGHNYAQENSAVFAKILFGESLTIEDVSIKFIDVISDSRCPKNVQCIWAGEAKILVAISKAGQFIEKKEIIFSGATINEKDHLLYTSKDLRILALGIKPYPETPDKISNAGYNLEIQIN